jgi:hypothetical protein
MDKAIEIIQKKMDNNNISFSEPFFMSNDNKTIMGEAPFSEILFLDYRDTEAGSNPREYTGLKKTNENIMKSLLKDYGNMFRFLHSGVIVSLVNAVVLDSNSIKYDDCCLTNGNQTRFIILIIILLKLIFWEQQLSPLKQKQINDFIKTYFPETTNTKGILSYIRFNKVNQIINFFNKNSKYRELFEVMNLNDFLDSKIRIQLNLINALIDDLEEPIDPYSAGTLIAEANNDTQKVKVDDIFGNKYKQELEAIIFRDFIAEYQDNVKIEYRLGEVVDKVEKVHILTLLRPVVATGILTKEKDIFNLTNKRDPVYRLFEQFLRKNKDTDKVAIVSKLIPLLYNTRKNYVIPILENHKRKLKRDYKEKALMGDLENSIINDDIAKVKNNDVELEKLINKSVNYNIEHILPVLIFRLRNLIVEDNENSKLKFNIDDNNMRIFLKTLIEIIYEKYVEHKLEGLPTSLTTIVRSKKFYDIGSESYKTLIRTYKVEEGDFVYRYRTIVI